jgi:drug/metabolite transporter (DMT)-like permease
MRLVRMARLAPLPDNRGVFAYAVPYILVASLQYQFAKDGLQYISPLLFMGIRYLVASAICFAIVRSFRPILNRDTFLLGLFAFISSGFWAVGLQYVSAGQSAVLSYTMPLFAIPLSVVLLKEGTTRFGALGAAIGFAGVATYGYALSGVGGSPIGIAFSVTNAFFWGLYTVYYRKLKGQDPVRTVATQFLVGGLLFVPFSAFGFYLNPAPALFIDLGYVTAIGGAASLLLWNAMTRVESIGKVTTLAFGVPATSVVIQALLTGEIPTTVEIAGVAIMFVGIYISRLRPGRVLVAPPTEGPATPVAPT